MYRFADDEFAEIIRDVDGWSYEICVAEVQCSGVARTQDEAIAEVNRVLSDRGSAYRIQVTSDQRG